MAELKTRIILRNDTTADWEKVKANDKYKLLKGEIGIEFVKNGSPKMKIGDDTSTWEALPYFGGTATELFETTLQSGDASKEEAINRVVGDKVVENGDFAIVKAPIGDGTGKKYEYTAFIYSEGAWKALDGNYDAENVYFSNNLTYTADIGVFTVPSSGSGTIPAAGKNLKEVLAGILAKEKNPETTEPSLSVSLTGAGAKEVGTSVTPTYSTTFNAGSYSYGPATGVTATSYSISDTNSSTSTTARGSLTAFTVEDGTNYEVSATVNYGDGAIPKTNIGNDYAEGQIKAGSKFATSSTITGYRNTFYGFVTDKSGEITSAVIRGLAGKRNGSISAGNTFKAAEAVDAMRVIIALPTPRTCTSIKDENGLNAEALSAFTKITVSVEGANGYTAKEYNVYYKDNAAANNKANNWVVTVG